MYKTTAVKPMMREVARAAVVNNSGFCFLQQVAVKEKRLLTLFRSVKALFSASTRLANSYLKDAESLKAAARKEESVGGSLLAGELYLKAAKLMKEAHECDPSTKLQEAYLSLFKSAISNLERRLNLWENSAQTILGVNSMIADARSGMKTAIVQKTVPPKPEKVSIFAPLVDTLPAFESV